MPKEKLGNVEVDKIVEGVPISFERRRYSKTTVYTWAFAYIDGDWKSMGDPWKKINPGKKDLQVALQFLKTQ